MLHCPLSVNPNVLGLFATLLIPLLLPLFTRKYGLRIPARKWAVWYVFWFVLAGLIIVQIMTMKHILSVEPRLLDFGAGQSEMAIVIANNGTGTIKWMIQDNPSWLTVTPSSGLVSTDKDTVKVTLDRSRIPSGNLTAEFFVVGKRKENATVEVRVFG